MKTKDLLIKNLAAAITDAADLDSLVEYFMEGQIEYLTELTESELLELAKQYEIVEVLS